MFDGAPAPQVADADGQVEGLLGGGEHPAAAPHELDPCDVVELEQRGRLGRVEEGAVEGVQVAVVGLERGAQRGRLAVGGAEGRGAPLARSGQLRPGEPPQGAGEDVRDGSLTRFSLF